MLISNLIGSVKYSTFGLRVNCEYVKKVVTTGVINFFQNFQLKLANFFKPITCISLRSDVKLIQIWSQNPNS